MTSPSIFITGATGLLGSHLARLLLARGYTQITAVRRPTSRMDLLGDDADRIQWIEGNVLDLHALEEGMDRADWVFHSAGLISYHPGHAQTMMSVNKEGTANVVNTALKSGVRKLVHMSSVSVLARIGRHQTISEETTWQRTRYTSKYGVSKFLAEQEVHRGIGEGLHASIVIPSIILGAGAWNDGSASIFHKISKGMPVYPKGQNGFVDVRDVCALALKVIQQEEPYRVIANGHTLSYRLLFSEIAQRIAATPPRIAVGPLAAEVAWRACIPVRWITGKQSVVNKETARASQCFPVYDNSASLRMPGFGYTPLNKTLDDIAVKYLAVRKKNFKPAFLDFSAEYLV